MTDKLRNFVMDHMSRNGSSRDLLTLREWGFVWLCGDGFGTVSEGFAKRHCWDWSHVRDSSHEGFLRMAEAIISIRNRKNRPLTVTVPEWILITQV